MPAEHAMQVIHLNGETPPEWEPFGQRWRQWRQRCDRRHWSTSWQGQAWLAGQLVFPSPWGDGELATQLSVRKGLVFGYVLHHRDRRALLLPGWLGGGHELEALYLLREQVLLLLPSSLAPAQWFLLALAELLPQLVTSKPWPEVRDDQRNRRLILEGHPNFAHQLLNVLSALEELADSQAPVQWLGQEPFGPVRALHPSCNWCGSADVMVLGEVFELPLSQRPERLPGAMRQRIRLFCEQRLGPSAHALLDGLKAWRARGGRVLWVSLKTRGACADGLPALVAAWMRELAQRGQPLPMLLLDGFSIQHGDTLANHYYGSSVAEMLEEERQQAGEIRAALDGLELPVQEAIGLDLAESIALGQAADGYLCHQGTVQHKLGWCQEVVPGVVHSGSWRSREGRHPWGGLGGLEPLWLPTHFSEDLEEGPRGRYRFCSDRLQDAAGWLADQWHWRTDG